MTISEHLRFWSLVRRDSEDGCWIWQGGRRTNYGKFSLGGRIHSAHRLMWSITRSDPGDLFVCHKCDVRPCVNPSHLFLGTHSENIQDMYDKGLDNNPRGERHAMAILTENDVRRIRQMGRLSNKQRLDVAISLGVSLRTIQGICWGQSWRSVR